MSFELTDRKKKILSAVVNENIKNADAVSSKDLQEKYFSDISSATIRNELQALEELGYLEQPYTSSGRVPTETGFKKYVTDLMPETKLSKKEIDNIKQKFSGKLGEMETIAKETAKVISDATHYASVVYLGVLDEAVIDKIKIVKLTDDSALVVVMTDLGIIKDITMTTDSNFSDEDYQNASTLLSEAMSGRTLAEVHDADEIIKSQSKKYKFVFDMIISVIDKQGSQNKMVLDGASNLLSQPEYQSVDKAKRALSIFEDSSSLVPILSAGNNVEISIKVGGDSKLKDCSIVSAEYRVNGKKIGHAGVIGPVRMDYAKAITVLKNVSALLDEKMTEEYKKGSDKKWQKKAKMKQKNKK